MFKSVYVCVVLCNVLLCQTMMSKSVWYNVYVTCNVISSLLHIIQFNYNGPDVLTVLSSEEEIVIVDRRM